MPQVAIRHPFLVLHELTAGVACQTARIVETFHLRYCSVVKVDAAPQQMYGCRANDYWARGQFSSFTLARYMRLL